MLGLTRSKRWTDDDRALAQAWSINRAMTCPGCGMFIDETTEVHGWHEVDTAVCDGCRALEEHQKAEKNPEPGAKDFVVKSID